MSTRRKRGTPIRAHGQTWDADVPIVDPGDRLEAARRADLAWREARQARAEAWLPGILHARHSCPMILEWWSVWTRRMGTLSSLAGFGMLMLGCLSGWVEAGWAGIVLMLISQRGWFLPMVALTPFLVWSGRVEAALHHRIVCWARSQGLNTERRVAERRSRQFPRLRHFL